MTLYGIYIRAIIGETDRIVIENIKEGIAAALGATCQTSEGILTKSELLDAVDRLDEEEPTEDRIRNFNENEQEVPKGKVTSCKKYLEQIVNLKKKINEQYGEMVFLQDKIQELEQEVRDGKVVEYSEDHLKKCVRCDEIISTIKEWMCFECNEYIQSWAKEVKEEDVDEEIIAASIGKNTADDLDEDLRKI